MLGLTGNRKGTMYRVRRHLLVKEPPRSKEKANSSYGQFSTLRPARASAAATTGSMAIATTASMATTMARAATIASMARAATIASMASATTLAATIYSLSRTGTGDGYAAA